VLNLWVIESHSGRLHCSGRLRWCNKERRHDYRHRTVSMARRFEKSLLVNAAVELKASIWSLRGQRSDASSSRSAEFPEPSSDVSRRFNVLIAGR